MVFEPGVTDKPPETKRARKGKQKEGGDAKWRRSYYGPERIQAFLEKSYVKGGPRFPCVRFDQYDGRWRSEVKWRDARFGTGLHKDEEDCARAWDCLARKIRNENPDYAIFPEESLNFPHNKIHPALAHLKPKKISKDDLTAKRKLWSVRAKQMKAGQGSSKKQKGAARSFAKGTFYDASDLSNRCVQFPT